MSEIHGGFNPDKLQNTPPKKPKKSLANSLAAKALASVALLGSCSISDRENNPNAAVPVKKELGPKAYAHLPNYGEGVPEKNRTSDKDSDLVFDPSEVESLGKKYGEERVQRAMKYIQNGYNFHTLPKPEKQQKLAETKNILRDKYSHRIKIPKFFGYIDDSRELQQICSILWNIDEIKRRAGKNRPIHITPEFVVAAMSNEGNILDIRGDKDQWESEVSGFRSLGLDTFGSNVDDIIDRGLLPKNFRKKFEISEAVNEKGGVVKSARFISKGDAIRAFISELAVRQMDARRHLKQNNIDLNEIPEEKRQDIILFITYIYYNAGPTVGRRIINSFNSPKDLVNYFERAENDPNSINLRSAPANAYVVMAGMEWMDRCGIFDDE